LTIPNDPGPKKKRLTPSYLLFYILLSEDTWRFLIGFLLAVVLAPVLLPFDRTGIGRYIMFLMVVAIGWAVSKAPSRWMVRWIAQWLPNRQRS
jgi:hypothetical protein